MFWLQSHISKIIASPENSPHFFLPHLLQVYHYYTCTQEHTSGEHVVNSSTICIHLYSPISTYFGCSCFTHSVCREQLCRARTDVLGKSSAGWLGICSAKLRSAKSEKSGSAILTCTEVKRALGQDGVTQTHSPTPQRHVLPNQHTHFRTCTHHRVYTQTLVTTFKVNCVTSEHPEHGQIIQK